jgi:hypothetical protein
MWPHNDAPIHGHALDVLEVIGDVRSSDAEPARARFETPQDSMPGRRCRSLLPGTGLPAYVPPNHLVEETLVAAIDGETKVRTLT